MQVQKNDPNQKTTSTADSKSAGKKDSSSSGSGTSDSGKGTSKHCLKKERRRKHEAAKSEMVKSPQKVPDATVYMPVSDHVNPAISDHYNKKQKRKKKSKKHSTPAADTKSNKKQSQTGKKIESGELSESSGSLSSYDTTSNLSTAKHSDEENQSLLSTGKDLMHSLFEKLPDLPLKTSSNTMLNNELTKTIQNKVSQLTTAKTESNVSTALDSSTAVEPQITNYIYARSFAEAFWLNYCLMVHRIAVFLLWMYNYGRKNPTSASKTVIATLYAFLSNIKSAWFAHHYDCAYIDVISYFFVVPSVLRKKCAGSRKVK